MRPMTISLTTVQVRIGSDALSLFVCSVFFFFRSACPFVCFAILLLTKTSYADESVDFEESIRPLFQRYCVECHGPLKQSSGLRLDAKGYFFQGGDNGKIVLEKQSHASELIKRMESSDEDFRMPPNGEKVPGSEVLLIRKWIDGGAPWNETEYDRVAMEDRRRDHWAWQPIIKPNVPAGVQSQLNNRFKNEIDSFVDEKLRTVGLGFSPEADRRTLLRRLTFDLLGLPPTAEQILDFENDTSEDAYEKLVDRLLESPHYGERSAQHWLDIAHYADTHGFERDQIREHGWRYRDWVIDAFNADKPYSDFLQEQIAGDALRLDDPNATVALGFLASGPWDFVGQVETPSPVIKRLARADDLDDMVTQVMSATCAITINCARCHDHKLDPISQREYYSLCAVFAGSKRGNRSVSSAEEAKFNATKADLVKDREALESEMNSYKHVGWSLADIAGGGNGMGNGKIGMGIDPLTGNSISEKRGFLEAVVPNEYRVSPLPIIDGVFVPQGGLSDRITVASTGLQVTGIPKTSGKVWDAIRNGPVHSQFSSKIGDIDYSSSDHSLLSLHANVAVTLDLHELPALKPIERAQESSMYLRGCVAYFGQTPKEGATVTVWVDGKQIFQRKSFGREDGLERFDIPLPLGARFLTLMATDNGNDIGHDQIGFADAYIEPADVNTSNEQQKRKNERLEVLRQNLEVCKKRIADLKEPAKVYAIVSDIPPVTKLMLRGNPEQTGDEVMPGSVACIEGMPSLDLPATATDPERRIALAKWITHDRNPLIWRVMVNRIWQQHFGAGIVETPSDFGIGGVPPTHPELLDWLACLLRERNGSLKAIHRQICCSATYRQGSVGQARSDFYLKANQIDSGNKLLWRQSARRLDGESLRDAVLFASGCLNSKMYGPGFRDFEYKEEYAPVYTYVTRNDVEEFRRSIYRFRVRTTPHPLLTTFDCPNPANFTPTRSVTTTALQSLAMLNHDFIFQQSKQFAEKLERETENPQRQIENAWLSAFARKPTNQELESSLAIATKHGLDALCRFILNANEFVYID